MCYDVQREKQRNIVVTRTWKMEASRHRKAKVRNSTRYATKTEVGRCYTKIFEEDKSSKRIRQDKII